VDGRAARGRDGPAGDLNRTTTNKRKGEDMTTRRSILKGGVALLAMPALATRAFADGEFGSAELIAAAKKEGRLVYYTANFAEVEQEVINAFNKRFPEIRVEMVRAPGGQLITRVKTEAAANKLSADVIDHSDRALMIDLVDLFQDYAPPNAADYRTDVMISPKLWPRITIVWSIAYNSALVQNPPRTWMDLTKPEYGKKQIGQVIAASGGTTWTRVMFERQVLGEDYWKKQAATDPILYPSGAPMADALVRGEINMGPLLYNAIFPKQRDGAPVEMVFPPEGAPVNPYASGVPKTAAHPNAAKLFLNWCMSAEGQTFMIKEQGNLTSLKKAPFYPKGFDPDKVKLWVPDMKQYVALHKQWVEDWNKTYNYRQ
jgi:iron(III) transport system substrate-binding protein